MVAATDTTVATLHQTMVSCSKFIEAGDYNKSDESIAQLVNFLNSISDSLVAGKRENADPEKIAVEILTQIHQYMASPAVKQEVIDALAFELPKAVARFACVSTKCVEIAEDLVYWFIERGSPRDMLSILCEAIGSPSELFTVPGYFIPLLGGLMKVLVLIQRRHYQQVKSAVPVILNVLKTMCSTSDDEDTDHEKLFHKATGIAYSIRSICVNLEGEDKKKLRALLGLYVLQIMALASFGITSDLLKCLSVVVELSDFLQHCELSYVGLITGCEVDTIYKLVVEDDSKDGMDCFSQLSLEQHLLVVIWGYKASEVATAAKADLPAVIMELQDSALRKDAFSAFKKVLADIPTSVRFDVLRALIKNSDSSSMIGILLDCVKEEMRMGKIERNSSADAVLNSKVSQSIDFWNPSVLELVEVVLRPPKGGPPSIPQSSDAVLSALNLYRFILINESSGNSNSTGILSKDKLQKAYNEWLLPLRMLVTGTMAESQKDYDNLACDTICALNPVELVLYRCIELVEEKLKQL
ncbi:UNVERIFIED_CONTAM: Aberrant root formation protein 4 [Sesamum latifolium]|uniref:Aberrant root formation protein 4 n=1 Tax=Sesamum latifolium TaxID=2727402 RepID=A0AAW2XGF6_9LAMI